MTQKSKILEGLNKEQQAAAGHGQGPLLIVAGAGTGKTTVVTKRIAYLIEQGIKPESILAMAFGEKAAGEMAERVDLLLPYGYYNLQVSTFHSFCERILKEYGLEIGLPDFKVLDEVGQWLLIRNNLDKFDLDYYRPLGNPTRFIRALASHFARCKDELITPAEYLEYTENQRLNSDKSEALNLTPALSSAGEGEEGEVSRIAEVANAYHVYQRLMLQNGALDFGDLINYAFQLFKKRPKILKKLRKQYEYILIDEFQDTNYAQYELLKLLAEPKNNLTVVGDDDQSIFKFRGASISNILHFQRDYPKAKFISLTQNYRSGQKILDLAHEFIKQNDPDRLEVKLKIDKKLRGVGVGGKIRHDIFDDGTAEAAGVVEKILEIKNLTPALSSSGEGVSWNDFAILARSHDGLEPFINALDERDIPYIYSASRGLYRKPIILDLLAYFRLLDNYHESADLYRVLNFPVFGIDHGQIVEMSHYAKKKSMSLFEAVKAFAANPSLGPSAPADDKGSGIRKFLSMLEKHSILAREKSVSEVLVAVVTDLEFSRFLSTETAVGLQNGKYLQALARKIQNFLIESADKSLKTFLGQINFEIEAGSTGALETDPEAGPEAVKLMTAHGAKGLEFTHVFIVSLVDKRFPTIERSEQIEIPEVLIKDILPEGDIHLEEERRLMYVAMTRAKQGLYLSRAIDYGGKLTKKPSRFLIELGLAETEKTRPTGKTEFISRRARRQNIVNLPVPKYFSFSQISLFKSCPLEYKYRYILGLPTRGGAALSFGLTMHKTFEKFLKLLKQQETTPDLFGNNAEATLPRIETLEKYYNESWIGDWFDNQKQMEDYRELGRKMLKMFFAEISEHRPRPKFLEAFFKMRLASGWFTGKIDRADETASGLLIIDYKTGQARGINKVDREQLLIYQWAAQEFFKEKVADLQYWFLKDKLKKESFIGKEEDIERLKNEIELVISEIIEATKANSFYELDLRISHECEFRNLE